MLELLFRILRLNCSNPLVGSSIASMTLSHWGELLRRHWNYALGQRLDWLRRTIVEPSASGSGKTQQAPSRS